jgi:hypothetical protein
MRPSEMPGTMDIRFANEDDLNSFVEDGVPSVNSGNAQFKEPEPKVEGFQLERIA